MVERMEGESGRRFCAEDFLLRPNQEDIEWKAVLYYIICVHNNFICRLRRLRNQNPPSIPRQMTQTQGAGMITRKSAYDPAPPIPVDK